MSKYTVKRCNDTSCKWIGELFIGLIELCALFLFLLECVLPEFFLNLRISHSMTFLAADEGEFIQETTVIVELDGNAHTTTRVAN